VVEIIAEHPGWEELRAYGQGRLAAAAAVALENHLASCETCCALLETTPGDSFQIRLRAAGSAAPGEAWHDSGPAAATVSDTPAVPPELVDHPRYRVLGLVGQGGMGAVYRAEHRRMQRLVALKVIHPTLMRRPAAVKRFHQEVRAAARLQHPNIVHAYDADQAGGLHFLVMEYVEGTSLAELVRQRGPLPVAEACVFARQAALGLQHAHERGMVHRDVKPQNLMVVSGEPSGTTPQIKILDFGLARLPHVVDNPSSDEAPSAALTGIGTVMGTADYIAPEQVADPHAADIRADIYALGCTLFHLLSGRPPFPDGAVRDKLDRHADTPLPSFDAIRPEVPARLSAVLARMTAKSPADRHATPAEVAEALAPFCPPEDIRPQRSPRRRLRTVAALGLLTVGLLAGAIILYVRPDRGTVVVQPADTLPEPATQEPAAQGDAVPKADDLEAEALRAVQQIGGKVRRDEKAPGKPIISVNLAGTKATDADLPRVIAFEQLRSLDLDRTLVTDTGLEFLARRTQLTSLVLTRTHVTDAGMKSVAEFKNLRWLNLQGTPIGDAGMQALVGLIELRALTLTSTRVTDVGMADVGRLKNLAILIVNDTAISDEGLKSLSGLSEMTNLSLAWAGGVGDEGMKGVAHFAKLRSLNLYATRVTDRGLSDLAGLKRLCTLELGGLKITDAGVKSLSGLTELQVLDLAATDVTDEGVKAAAQHPRLMSLNLSEAVKVTDDGVKALAGLRELNILTLAGTRVTDVGLAELAGLPLLKFLDLAKTDVTDAGLPVLLRCPRLTSLNLIGAKNVTVAGAAELRKGRPNIQVQR
jgi:Protein kinase domain/Leucine Rich repeat